MISRCKQSFQTEFQLEQEDLDKYSSTDKYWSKSGCLNRRLEGSITYFTLFFFLPLLCIVYSGSQEGNDANHVETKKDG